MKGVLTGTILAFGILLICIDTACSEPLQGGIGSSSQWGSGWLDLSTMTDFKQGDKLELRVGGSARKVVVRLLSRGTDPNTPSGIDGGVLEVPESRILVVVLQEDHKNVVQISVHGETNPWGLFPLGGGNGPATLLSAKRISPQKESCTDALPHGKIKGLHR